MKGKLSAVSFGVVLSLAGVVGNQVPAFAAGHPAGLSRQAVRTSAQAPSGAWTVYHRDSGHTGYDPTEPHASTATAGWVSPTLDQTVYDEPLVYNGLVYVGTSNNTVYALNQGTGAVVWSTHLGAPQTSGWQCGNINPTGILGTGLIDVAQSRVYYVAFLTQFHSYYLYGLDLATGTIMLTTQVLPNGFDWTIQQQRGALALSTDGSHIYIPFGGRDGDCGPYHGWVEGLPTAGSGMLADEHYETPSTGSGIWAAGGVVVDNSTGNVLFATGNAIPCAGAINSDSVIRTAPTLGAATSFFQPSDWAANWCGPDLDLGSASPVLISPSLMFTSGKYGSGFLLNPAGLGGTSDGLFRADVCHGINSDATFGSFAYAAPYVYLECNGGGLVALQVNTAAQTFSQCAASCIAPSWWVGGSTTFGPPIVAGGAVWVIATGGGGLYGFDASTGTQIYHSAAFGANHFVTPSEAGGQLFVPADTVVRSFNIVAGCAGVTPSASPTSPQVIGTPVTISATASGCPNPSPSFEFWILNPGSSTWQLAQSYTTSSTYPWATTGLPAGTYRFSVWVKDSSSTATYDAFNANLYYTLTATPPCSGAAVTADKASPQQSGTIVTFTASSTACPNPQYRFWIGFGSPTTWVLARDYGGATYVWNTAGDGSTAYTIDVWAREQGSTAAEESAGILAYTLSVPVACATASIAADKVSPQQVGTVVTFTGSATGCSQPQFRWWYMPPGGSWTMLKDYSTGTALAWNTAGLAPGTYSLDVWTRQNGSSASVEAGFAISYTLTAAVACSNANVAPDKASPQAAGTTITFTATSTGCSQPIYKYWIQAPGGSWTVAQDGSLSPTFVWNTTGLAAGTYNIDVWVYDNGSSSVQSYVLVAYSLT